MCSMYLYYMYPGICMYRSERSAQILEVLDVVWSKKRKKWPRENNTSSCEQHDTSSCE